MRVTFNMRGMQMKDMLSTSLSNYTEAVKKANAQQSLINPWEDTSKYVGAYNVQNMIDELTQFSENANSASNWLNNTNAELQELLEALKKARDDYAIAGASDSYDEESRKALAQDVLSLYNQIMDIANASYNGRYIFGGFQTEKPPFTGGTNSVTNVVTKNENGENLSGDAIVKDVFSDMTELKSGKYTAKMVIDNNTGIAKLQLYDEKGNVVIMDSNGSDEAGGSGNKSSVSMSFEYEPGKVINTGRGISFKMPEDLENATSIVMEFDYKSGSEITYQGDNGYIYTQIGYSQDIAVNMPGSNIFTQSSLILQGSAFNTVNGMAATINSLFSNLDNTNIGIGDSIEIAGTDHNGNKVGIASLVSNTNPSLDLASATEKERTLTITYGDKLYKVVVPQKAYSSTDELANAINNELKNAEYVGSLSSLSGLNASIDTYASTINEQVNSGKFQGETTTEEKNKYKVDLSSELKISADGDRLNFMSQKTGDNVRIAVTGTDQSLLGFKGATVAAEGKDTTFEIGYDFHTDTINPVETTHKNFDLTGTSYTFFVNGKEVVINKPATTFTPSAKSGLRFGSEDVILEIGDKKIEIKADSYNSAIADGQNPRDFLNEKLREAGLGGETAVTTFTDNGDGTFDIGLMTTSPSKKELEFLFDEALRKAGFDFEVGVSLDLNPNDPANLGNYDITFSLQNYNMDRDTTLTTTAYDRTTIPPTSDMQTAKIDRSRLNDAEEKTLGDYVKFIEDLYGQTVDVSIVDGKLTIADLRSGDSKLTFRTNAKNQGISHANDQMTIVGGAYSGKKDDTWNVSVTTTLGQNDQRNIAITIVDKNGNTIYNKVTNDYKGGPIELLNGVTITPDDMEIPNPLDPTKKESTTTFQIDLKAQPGLNFGDVNIKETGKNVNVFRALENLMHALEYNITKNGFGEPSAWKATDLNSTAKPFLDGVFQGNFNDNWKYEILSANQKTDFYLQNEYKTTSGNVQYDETAYQNAIANNIPLTFSVDIFDNKTGKVERKDVEIDLSKANPEITNAETAQEYILKELNNNPDFVEAGIRFANNNGTIEIQSGSGTKIANFANSATNPAERAFASFVMGFDTVANGELPDTFTAAFTFRVADPLDPDPAGAGFKEITIDPVVNENIANVAVSASETFALDINGHKVNISSKDFMAAADKDAFINEKLKEAGISVNEGATQVTNNGDGTYSFQVTAFSSKEDILAKINSELADAATGTNGRIKANIAADGSIQFVTSGTDLPVEVSVESGAYNPLSIGLTHNGGTGSITELAVSGVQTPKTDLSELSEDARTLTITYYDENTKEQKEVKVTLDKKEYKSTQEMVEHINEQLVKQGISADNLNAVVNSKGEISFAKSSNSTFGGIVVEGDYAGTLGFPKAGDSVSVKVTNAEGGLVQNVTLDTANKSVFVSDGLHLGFDAGSLSATDSFTAAVGSGVENEIDSLDAAVNQVLQAGTLIGTRGQRVESVIKFQETVITNNEEIKAGYLGATATDVIKLTTDLELSKTAYQSAMSIVTSMMSISILDFLG